MDCADFRYPHQDIHQLEKHTQKLDLAIEDAVKSWRFREFVNSPLALRGVNTTIAATSALQLRGKNTSGTGTSTSFVTST